MKIKSLVWIPKSYWPQIETNGWLRWSTWKGSWKTKFSGLLFVDLSFYDRQAGVGVYGTKFKYDILTSWQKWRRVWDSYIYLKRNKLDIILYVSNDKLFTINECFGDDSYDMVQFRDCQLMILVCRCRHQAFKEEQEKQEEKEKKKRTVNDAQREVGNWVRSQQYLTCILGSQQQRRRFFLWLI